MDYTSSGVYMIRTEDAQKLAEYAVMSWVECPAASHFRSCLWLTSRPAHEVEQLLLPFIKNAEGNLQGLDVISIRDLLHEHDLCPSTQALCRSLDTLSVLNPRLVIIEDARMWLNNPHAKLLESSPLAQLKILQSWAYKRSASVLLPVQGALPQYAAFVDGLTDANTSGKEIFKPWWPTPWGKVSGLWNDTSPHVFTGQYFIFDNQQSKNLGLLAKSIYLQRFEHDQKAQIHVLLDPSITQTEATLLLRMGADCVVRDANQWAAEFDMAAKSPLKGQLLDPEHTSVTNNFAKDLQEILTPGQLCLISRSRFCSLAIMLIELSERWGFECTLTRLSLLNHVSAMNAAKLIAPNHVHASILASSEAIYLLRIWTNLPTDEQLNNWIDKSFKGPNAAIFGGLIHYNQKDSQRQFLQTLSTENETLTQADIELDNQLGILHLTDVWSEQNLVNNTRPWTANLETLFKLDGTNKQ